MKHKGSVYYNMLTVFCYLFGFCFIFASCNNSDLPKTEFLPYEKFNPVHIINALGKEPEQAYLELNVDPAEDIAKEHDQGHVNMVTLKNPLLYEQNPVRVRLAFQDQYLIRVEYIFQNMDQVGWSFAQEAYRMFQETYGEAETYPTLPNRIFGLTLDSFQMGSINSYREHWIMEGKGENFLIPWDIPADRRADLVIVLEKHPAEDDLSETVVSIGWDPSPRPKELIPAKQ